MRREEKVAEYEPASSGHPSRNYRKVITSSPPALGHFAIRSTWIVLVFQHLRNKARRAKGK